MVIQNHKSFDPERPKADLCASGPYRFFHKNDPECQNSNTDHLQIHLTQTFVSPDLYIIFNKYHYALRIWMTEEIQLYRALSKLGYASRTQALSLIKNGEIRIHNKPCTDPEMPVSLTHTKIFHHDHLIQKEDLQVLLLYKPRSIITSRKDEQNRPTVYSLLPDEFQKLHCVGRLDYATSGLLLLTNNTRLSSWLTDPENGVKRVYIVTVRGLVTPDEVSKMIHGVSDDGDLLISDDVIIRKSSQRESHLVITLTEGKNREIRRMCKNIGHEVTRLKRVSYGPLSLGNLAPGEFRSISIDELAKVFPEAHYVIDS
jgi:23S rRNA pseudouridine2605 synthase